MIKDDKPAKCTCGRRPDVYVSPTGLWMVQCPALEGGCWWGPQRKTKRGGIDAWNRLMGAREGKR